MIPDKLLDGRQIEEETDIFGPLIGAISVDGEGESAGNAHAASPSHTREIFSEASALHRAGDHRRSFQRALQGAIQAARELGVGNDSLSPLDHLYQALSDLDRGSLDKALEPLRVSNRRIDTSTEWAYRAMLAAAVDARMNTGESERTAALEVTKKVPIGRSGEGVLPREKAITRLTNWRKLLRSQISALQWERYNFSLRLLSRALSLEVREERDNLLLHYEELFIDQARDFLSRTGGL